MSETLRPSTLGEILDRTAQLYRRNFWLFAGVAALPIGVIIAMTALGTALVFSVPGVRDGYSTSPVIPILTVALLVLLVVPVYITAAVYSYAGLTEAAAGTYRGEKISIRGALKSARPWFWRYLWFIILQGIVVAFIPAAIAGGAVGALFYGEHITGGNLATAALFGFMVFVVVVAAIVAIIWLVLGYSLSIAVCVVEKKPAWESLQRGWNLSRGTRGRIVVMFLLVFALAMVVSMIAAIPSLIVIGVMAAHGNGAAQSSTAFVVAEVVRVISDFVLQTLIAPISSIALVLFYYDQRIRKEGFDIEWMMQQAGLAPVQAESGFASDPGILGVSQPTSAPALPAAPGISAPAAPPDTVE
jgi:magnesium-transporting ATPase (P-type)